MKKEYEGYYEFLLEEMKKFRGDFDRYILYVADFFRLLCDILDDKRIKKEDRLKICGVLGYFVVPKDIIPEKIYGPAGYIDDIFLCTYILKDLEKKYGVNFLSDYWKGEEDFKEVLDYSFEKSYKIIKKKNLKKQLLEYVGLR